MSSPIEREKGIEELVEARKEIEEMKEKANNSAETEEILTYPFSLLPASTAIPYHYPTNTAELKTLSLYDHL